MNNNDRQASSLILVVDDDPAMRFLAKRSLEKAGHRVNFAENGIQALASITEMPPDIVLLDVVMPKMNGYTTCSELRKLSEGKNMPVLMVTSLDDVESIHRAYEAGATDFITKPINWLILEHRIRYLLRSAQAMDNLRISEEKNRALLNAIPDTMFRIREDGMVLEYKKSKPFDQMISVGESPHKRVSDIFPAEFADRLLHHMKESIKTGESQIFEYRLQVNADSLDVENRIVVSGKDEVLVILRDDTLRKSAEEALRKAREDLERRVEARTEELMKANRKLHAEIRQRKRVQEDLSKAYKDLKSTQSQLVQSAKLASIGELAAGIVHELNQPLMIIRGYAQNLSKNPGLSSEQTKGLMLIEKNTGRMTNIINHLRVFSRQSQSDFKRVHVNKIIEDAFLMIGEQLRIRNIEAVKRLDSDLPMVIGDPNKLEQVFLNLITNARDAIEEKRAKERLVCDTETGAYTQPRAGKLEIVTRWVDASVEILITDDGCGISDEKSDKIFDPFFTTKEVGKGTGLGLSISYGIVKEHDAEIDLKDTGHQGTTFRIKIPVDTANY
jgi:signal transduction histidine kinase